MAGPTREEVLKTEYSFEFDELCKDAVYMSHFKYGSVKECYEIYKTADAIKSLKMRLDKYEETGNTEFLVNVANFARIEFMYPRHPKAYYRATDSSESPGLYGMGVEEIRRFKEEADQCPDY